MDECMDRRVYWVSFMGGPREDQRPFGIPFECRHMTIEALADELGRNGVVAGSKVFLDDDGQGGRVIRSREEFAFGVGRLCTIQIFRAPVREAVG